MASYILYEQKRETRETKESIITEAAKLIKSKVKDLDKMSKMYPAFDEFSDVKGQKEWINSGVIAKLSSELEQVLSSSLLFLFLNSIQIIKNDNVKSHKVYILSQFFHLQKC